MSEPKVASLPLHEILSVDLYVLGASIRSEGITPMKIVIARLILDAFRRAKLKPDHAREIAEANYELPAILIEAGQLDLADLATKVFAGLAGPAKDSESGERDVTNGGGIVHSFVSSSGEQLQGALGTMSVQGAGVDPVGVMVATDGSD